MAFDLGELSALLNQAAIRKTILLGAILIACASQ